MSETPDPISPAEALKAHQAEAEKPEDSEIIPLSGVVNLQLSMPDGSKREGIFHYKLPISVSEQVKIGIIARGMRGGQPPEVFDVDTVTLVQRVAYLSVAAKSAPDWMTHAGGEIAWMEIPDFLVHRIFEEVTAHEARFRGRCRSGTPTTASGK